MKIDNFKEILAQIDSSPDKMAASYWGNALAGEVGETCNLIKKYERDGLDIKYELRLELADIFNYLVLTARFFEINLEQAILDKIEILKIRKQQKEKLEEK